MKKVFMIISLLVCVIGLTGCSKYKTYTELSFDEFQNKLNNKDSFVVVMGSSTCSACAMYKKTMQDVIKDKQVEIFYLGLDKLNDEQYSKIYSKYVIESTPTTIFIKDGTETTTYDRIIGAASYSKVVDALKKHGIIGE